MTDSNNILTATLADLKTYFEGWHTSEYDALHTRITEGMKNDINQLISNSTAFDNKYAPKKHAWGSNEDIYGKGTESSYGHVKTIDNLNQNNYQAGQALSAHQGYELNKKITKVSTEIDNLKQPTIKVGRARGLNDNVYNEIASSQYGDGVLTPYVGNQIQWANGKIETEFNPTNPDRLIIQILDETGNPMPKARGNVYVLIHDVWQNLDIGDTSGVGTISIKFANERSLYNAILWGDQWFFVDIYVYDSVSDTGQMYKAVHKKVLLNYAQNLWDTYVKNGEIQYNNNGQPYDTTNNKIIDGAKGDGTEGIFEKINNNNNDKGYYRWERNVYPYGRPKKFPQNLGDGYSG